MYFVFSEIFIYHFFENLARYAFGKALTERGSFVAALADHRVDRNFCQQFDSELFRQRLSGAGGKDLGDFAAVRADKTAHIFHQPQHREFQLIAEIQTLCHIVCRNLLRSGHDDRLFYVLE